MKKLLLYIFAYIGVEFVTYKILVYVVLNCITTIKQKGDFMARHKVEICGVDTANIKVLSYDEQINLFKRFNK